MVSPLGQEVGKKRTGGKPIGCFFSYVIGGFFFHNRYAFVFHCDNLQDSPDQL